MPGMSPHSNRSFKPEWNEPAKNVAGSPSNRKLGTPEGPQAQLQAKRSPMRQRPAPGDIASPSSSPLGNKNVIAKSRPPSPGMGMIAMKRPPSPGDANRAPPSPGRNSPMPPAVRLSNESFEEENKSEVKKSPQKQKSVRFDESPPKQRFIFSQNPSIAAPPSRINVSSGSTQKNQGYEEEDNKPKEEAKKTDTFLNQPASPLKKQSNNPLRNNPLFLQRMAEAADSESDEDEELEMANAKEKIVTKATKKLTGMEKMKKLAEISNAKDLLPVCLTPDKGTSADEDSDFGSPLKFVDGPLPSNESEMSATGDANIDKFSNAGENWSTAQKSSSKNKLIAGLNKRGMNYAGSPLDVPAFSDEPLLQKEEMTDDMVATGDDNIDKVSNAGKHVSKAQKSPSTNKRSEGLKKRALNSVKSSSRFSQASLTSTVPSTTTNETKSKPTAPSLQTNISETSVSQKVMKESISVFVEKANKPESASQKVVKQSMSPLHEMVNKPESSSSPQKEKPAVETTTADRTSQKKPSSSISPNNYVPTAVDNSAGSQSISDNLSAQSMSSRRKMTIAEKLEKKRSTIRSSRRDSSASLVSAGGRSTASGKSRKEILDKVKGRMSRSPSPSPLMKKHMHSTQLSVRSKSPMRQMIEAREKKAAKKVEEVDDTFIFLSSAEKEDVKHPMRQMIETREKKAAKKAEEVDDTSIISSSAEKEDVKQNISGYKDDSVELSKQRHLASQTLNSVPSLISAPSDEKIKITSSTSSEHLSVRAGLSLLHKQNSTMHNLRNPTKVKSPTTKEKIQSTKSLSDNMNRMKVLREKQQRRDALKVQELEVTVSPKAIFEGSPPNGQSSPSRLNDDTDEDIRHEHFSKPADDEDDDFSIDEFHKDLSPSPKESGTGIAGKKQSGPLGSRSPWAEVMEQRLKENEVDGVHFNFDDHYTGETWSSDAGEKQRQVAPQASSPPREEKMPSSPPKPPLFVQSGVATERNLSFNNGKQSVPLQMSGPMHQNQIYDENVFVGAYEDLLPRSTNPLLVRTCEPTIPTSLMSVNAHFAIFGQPVKEDTLQTMLEADPVEVSTRTHKPVAAHQENTLTIPAIAPPALKRFEAPEASAARQGNRSTIPALDLPAPETPDAMRPFSPSEFMEVKRPTNDQPDQEFQRDPFPINSLSSSNSNDKYFTPPHNLVDGVKEPPQGEDESYLEESIIASTLIGQVHVGSLDEDAETANDVSESIAEWWDKSYAHTQDDHVNSDIKKALSNSKDSISIDEPGNYIIDDSDDDVFFGLDEGSPASKGSPTKRPIPSKVRSGKGRRVLEVSDSEDDSDFDKIMDESESPQRTKKDFPPPPPKSTPPNKGKKKNFQQKDADTTFNGISATDLDSSGEVNEKSPSPRKENDKVSRIKRSPESVKRKDTIGHSTYDDATFGNATLETGTFGEYTNDDSKTYDDGTYDDTLDDRSYSSKSSRSDGSHTFGSATLESMALNKRERKKWSDWERKDQDTVFSGYSDDFTMDSREMHVVMERRALAHEQLLMHAYTALSRPPPLGMAEKGTVLPEQHQSQLANSSNSQYQSDGENQVPVGPRLSKTIVKQRQVLEKFCV